MSYDLNNEFASISAYNYGDEEIMDDEKEIGDEPGLDETEDEEMKEPEEE